MNVIKRLYKLTFAYSWHSIYLRIGREGGGRKTKMASRARVQKFTLCVCVCERERERHKHMHELSYTHTHTLQQNTKNNTFIPYRQEYTSHAIATENIHRHSSYSYLHLICRATITMFGADTHNDPG